MQSLPRLAQMRPFLMTCCLLGVLALTGCAKPVPAVLIPVPETLRQPCPQVDREGVLTIGDLAAFSVRQEAALVACDARRAEAVGLIDRRNEQVTPKPWWRFGR